MEQAAEEQQGERMRETAADSVRLELDSAEYLVNPYPAYDALLAAGGSWRHPETGTVYIGRYADVLAMLRDWRRMRRESPGRNPLSRSGGEPNAVEAIIKDWLVFRDPPNHTRMRSVIKHAFTPQRIEGMRPLIERTVETLLDDLAGQDEIDALNDLAYLLPIIIITEMMGIPIEDREIFKAWSRAFARAVDRGLPDDIERGIPACLEFTEYFKRLVADRRKEPKDDLVSVLIAAQESEEPITDNELIANCINLVFAGHETTKNLIASGLVLLHEHPREQAKLRVDPALVDGAVEEFLRLEAPVQMITRWTCQEMTVAGHELAADQDVVAMVGAANRDPARFPNPHAMDVTRHPNKHLSFGVGIHTCLGNNLARLETSIFVNRFLERYPEFTVSGEPVWRPMAGFRTLGKLRLRVRPGAPRAPRS